PGPGDFSGGVSSGRPGQGEWGQTDFVIIASCDAMIDRGGMVQELMYLRKVKYLRKLGYHRILSKTDTRRALRHSASTPSTSVGPMLSGSNPPTAPSTARAVRRRTAGWTSAPVSSSQTVETAASAANRIWPRIASNASCFTWLRVATNRASEA